MTEPINLRYAPSKGSIHVWKELPNGETEHLFECDEVCDSGYCVGPEDLSQERRVSVGDVEVERKGDTVTVNLLEVASEPNE